MKGEPAWLSIEAVLAVHAQLVAEHGGSPPLRDRGLLESALAAPRNRFAYGAKDTFALAAAYAFALTRNHPFVDGNKRVAFMAAYTFLGINGWSLEVSEEQVVIMVVGLSDRSVTEEEFTAWLRNSCVPRTAKGAKRKRPARKTHRRAKRKPK